MMPSTFSCIATSVSWSFLKVWLNFHMRLSIAQIPSLLFTPADFAGRSAAAPRQPLFPRAAAPAVAAAHPQPQAAALHATDPAAALRAASPQEVQGARGGVCGGGQEAFHSSGSAATAGGPPTSNPQAKRSKCVGTGCTTSHSGNGSARDSSSTTTTTTSNINSNRSGNSSSGSRRGAFHPLFSIAAALRPSWQQRRRLQPDIYQLQAGHARGPCCAHLCQLG